MTGDMASSINAAPMPIQHLELKRPSSPLTITMMSPVTKIILELVQLLHWYKLTINTPIPGGEAVMKSTTNMTQLLHLQCTYDVNADTILLVNHMDCIVKNAQYNISSVMTLTDSSC